MIPLSGGTKKNECFKGFCLSVTLMNSQLKIQTLKMLVNKIELQSLNLQGINNNVGNDTYYSGGYKYNNTQVVSDYVAVKATNAEALKRKSKSN